MGNETHIFMVCRSSNGGAAWSSRRGEPRQLPPRFADVIDADGSKDDIRDGDCPQR